jgi:bacterioferritin
VERSVKGEQCAIDVHKRLLDATRERDKVTRKVVLEILDDEVEHEADLQSILEDIDMMKRM